MSSLSTMPVASPHSQWVGGRYQLLNLLGAGGMGQVYRAIDRLTGETVALKRVNTQGLGAAGDPQLHLALAHEFQALAGLRHPNIIGVRDYGFDLSATAQQQAGATAARSPYFTMELLYNSRSLVTAGQLLDPKAKLRLLLPVLHALAYIHRRGIIHRDLKPGNILVSEQEVKVLDFGLATIGEQTKPSSGTQRYMAPEVLRGATATVASDLYALGVIGYELFAGWHPFAPTGQHASLEQLLTVEPDWSYIDLDARLIAVLQRLLAKDPAARYPDAPAVIAALRSASGEVLPSETLATRESFLQAAPLIGRDRELDQLNGALERALTGAGSGWLIGGESGVGKSRLLNELRTKALVQGALVMRGQANSSGGGAYQLWREPLRWLVLLAAPTPLEAAILKPLLPELANWIGQPVADAPALEAKTAKTRLLTTIATMVRRSAVVQPLLILLEDLHWADENSLELLAWLTRPAEFTLPETVESVATPLLLIGTYRRGEAPKLPEQLPHMQTMLVARLLPDQIEALSVAMLGKDGRRAHLVNFLQQETEGNTFFVVEVLRALAEEAGELDRVAAMGLPKQIFPGGMQQVVQRRLQRIPPVYQPLLQWAAVAGRQLDLAILQRVQSDAALDSWLDLCANAMIFEVQADRWQFTHDKLREGILLTLSPEQRRPFHYQLALAIEAEYHDLPSPHYAQLAYHFEAAGERLRARHYLQLAGETAQNAYANSAAIDYYERALTLLNGNSAENNPDNNPDNNPENELQINVLLRLGDVLQFVGRWAEAEQRYQQVLALTPADKTAGEIRVRGYHALGLLQRNRGDFPGALGWLRQAEQGWAQLHDQSHLGEVLLEIGNVFYLQGDHKAGWRYLTEGLAAVQAAQNLPAVASALHRMGSVYYSSGNYGEAHSYAEQALALYQQLDNKVGMANALNNLGNIERSTGDYVTAQARRVASLTLRQEIGDKWGVAASLNNLAVIPYIQGDYATAQHYWTQSLALRNELGDRWGAGQTLDNLGLVAFSQGDYAGARRQHAESLTLRQTIGDRWGIATSLSNLAHAELYAAAFDPAIIDEAEQHYQESLELSLALDDKRGVISCTIGLTGVIVNRGNANEKMLMRAVQLLAIARQITSQTNAALERDEEILYAKVDEALHTMLPPHTYRTLWEATQQLSDAQINALLLQKEQP